MVTSFTIPTGDRETGYEVTNIKEIFTFAPSSVVLVVMTAN
jgi:hypothetical protein